MTYRAPTVPLSYTTPPFPSLYWPIRTKPGDPKYLYYMHDIWRYTLLWTLLTYGLAHLLVSACAVLMQFHSAYLHAHNPVIQRLSAKNRQLLGLNPIKDTLQWVWMIPTLYLFMGAVEALLAGSLVGLIVGAVYN